ncbi:MAG: type II toxin-antitoxin system VapC family toxin [Acidobacteriota bacterium]
MRLLLDTHIWLWSLVEPHRLSANVASALTAPDTERWLSPLSVWEALMAIERKRLEVAGPADAWVRQALERAPVTEAPVTTEVAFVSRALRSSHPDPVDRFLAATAQVFGLVLVTADQKLTSLKGITVLSNRTKGSATRRQTRS